jgi:drug/metabolite transporter (DMT)-like permease
MSTSAATGGAARTDSLIIRAAPGLFVMLWSTGFVVSKLGALHASPLTFLEWRYAISLALLLPIIGLGRAAWPRSPALAGHIAIAGVLVHAGYLAGVWSAIYLGMSPALAALIVGLQPLLTALAGPWVGERVGLRQWLGFVLGLAGVTLVLAERITLSGLSGVSIALSIMALVSITIGTLYQKRFCPVFDLRTGAFVQYAAAFVVTLPFALLVEGAPIGLGRAAPVRARLVGGGVLVWRHISPVSADSPRASNARGRTVLSNAAGNGGHGAAVLRRILIGARDFGHGGGGVWRGLGRAQAGTVTRSGRRGPSLSVFEENNCAYLRLRLSWFAARLVGAIRNTASIG